MKDISSSNQILVVRQEHKNVKEKKKFAFPAFMYLHLVNYRMDRDTMRQKLRMYELGRKVWLGLTSFQRITAFVREVRYVNRCFSVNNSLRQRYGICPRLFSIGLDGMIGEAFEKTLGRRVKMIGRDQRQWLLSHLLFADNTALVTESLQQLQCLITREK